MREPVEYSKSIQAKLSDAFNTHYSDITGKKKSIKLSNISFDDTPEPDDYERHKKILYHGGTEGVKMYADMHLVDNATGKTLDTRKKLHIGFVPTATNRYSFILNGKEYIVHNQTRLRAACYTKKDRNGIAQADFNLAKGKNMELKYLPAKEQLMMSINKSHVPLYTLLKDVYNVPENHLVKTLGSSLHEVEINKYMPHREKHINHLYDLLYKDNKGPVPETLEAKASKIKEKLDTTVMDPHTNMKTLGKAYNKIAPDILIHAAKDVLSIHKGEKEPSWKDNMAFKSIHSAEDFLHDKFAKPRQVMDFKNKLTHKIDKLDSLKGFNIKGAVQKNINSFFIDSNLVNYPMQINPYEFIENGHKITSLGEGGISSTESLPMDARNLHPSQIGFIDPVRTPDNMRAGVDNRVTNFTWKEGDVLKTVVKDKKGKIHKVSHTEMFDKVYMVEGEEPLPTYEKNEHTGEEIHRPNGLYRAFYKGKIIEVPKSQVTYFIPAEGMFTVTTGSIPFLQATHGQRCAMGAKMTTQALSLTLREQPLVDTYANLINTDKYHPKAKINGTVVGITPTKITIKDESGKTHEHNMPNNFPLNYHSYLHAEPIVKVGDKVKKDSLLAEHNFSKDGKMALGVNANVAFMPMRGYNFEDAVVVTETGAKKFSSNHIFQEVLEIPDRTIVTDVAKFKAYFPNKFTMSQLGGLNGHVVKKGAVVHHGDPLVVALKHKRESPEILLMGKMSSRIANPFADASLVWDKDYPGTVIDVIQNPDHIKVVVKAVAPLVEGDKIAGRYGNKGIVAKILADHEAPRNSKGEIPDVILNPAGISSRMNVGQLYETALGKILRKTGKGSVHYKNFEGGDTWAKLKKALAENKISTEDDYHDPVSGKTIPKVFNGAQYILKLAKQTEVNFAARAGGQYDCDLRPIKGGSEGAKSIGALDFYGLLAHNARDFLRESATSKSEFSPDAWAAIMSGHPIPAPKTTFAFEKMKAMFNGMGININKEGNILKLLPFSDKDIDKLSNGVIKSSKMVMDKPDPVTGLSYRPEKGGLFDPALTGGLAGSHWTHINLAKPVVNTLFERPIKALLDLKTDEFNAIAEGQKTMTVKGKELTGGEAIREALAEINVKDTISKLYNDLGKEKSALKRDKIAKKLKYLKAMDSVGHHPKDAYVLNKIPVLPPKFRPIYPKESSNELVVTDANHLYKDVINFNDQLAHPLTQALGHKSEQFKNDYKALFEATKKLQGLDGTSDEIGAANKRDPSGFLKVLIGSNPKYGYFQGKLLKRAQDLVGRATIGPDPELSIDEVGLPEAMAWTMYKPFVVGALVKNGYTLPRANEEIEKQTITAKNILQAIMHEQPVILNRAPTLHKFGMMAFKPKLIKGKTIKLCPLVVKGFGADYDGDTMTVHKAMGMEGNKDIWNMLPSNHLFSPLNKNPVHVPDHETIMGLNLMTRPNQNKPIKMFNNSEDAKASFNRHEIDSSDHIHVKSLK